MVYDQKPITIPTWWLLWDYVDKFDVDYDAGCSSTVRNISGQLDNIIDGDPAGIFIMVRTPDGGTHQTLTLVGREVKKVDDEWYIRTYNTPANTWPKFKESIIDI